MECDEKSRPEGSSYSRSTSIGNFIRRYLRSTAIVSTSAPSTSYFLSFFLSPSSSPFLSPSRNSLRRYASQERRAAVEQRTDINNPEFPTDVLIIRFQGPPILAGSRARKRIFLSSSRRTRSSPPLLFALSRPTFVPDRFLSPLPSPGVVLHFLRSFPLPWNTLRFQVCQQEQTKRNSPTPGNARSIFMAENRGTSL